MKLTEKYLRKLIRESISEIIGYHGTGADFDYFDDKHLSTGAGSQVFGYGTYIASSEKIGKDYAKMTQARCLTYKGEIVYSEKHDDKENFNNSYRLIYDVLGYKQNLKDSIAYVERLQDMCDPENTEMINLWKQVWSILKSSRQSDWKFKNQRILLTVEIPDNDGSNYINWDGFIEDVPRKYIYKCLYNELTNPDEWGNEYAGQAGIELQNELSRYANEKYQLGEELYGNLTYYLGNSEKYASEFLDNIGFDGIVYEAGRNFGGAKQGDVNYVIFNPKKIRIIKRDIQAK